ncbi:MAG: hypothetical protein CMB80_00960 [Flammeovirgaceae bacterium]|nr:hypothetical protein [Flammeovirgaceae bacterium]|tara:strand:- start:66 stop:329 length:264 start_codon:yes stop_codon:yes gene_type:complete
MRAVITTEETEGGQNAFVPHVCFGVSAEQVKEKAKSKMQEMIEYRLSNYSNIQTNCELSRAIEWGYWSATCEGATIRIFIRNVSSIS